MTMHGGLLRLETAGHGAIVDLTEGVHRIVAAAGVEQGVAVVFVTGSTAAITTMEHEPGGVSDLQALFARLIPAEGDYEHNRRNHDERLRPPPSLDRRAVGEHPDRRRPSRSRYLAADRASRLRRPGALADGHGQRPRVEGRRGPAILIRRQRVGAGRGPLSLRRRPLRAILICLPWDPGSGFQARP